MWVVDKASPLTQKTLGSGVLRSIGLNKRPDSPRTIWAVLTWPNSPAQMSPTESLSDGWHAGSETLTSHLPLKVVPQLGNLLRVFLQRQKHAIMR